MEHTLRTAAVIVKTSKHIDLMKAQGLESADRESEGLGLLPQRGLQFRQHQLVWLAPTAQDCGQVGTVPGVLPSNEIGVCRSFPKLSPPLPLDAALGQQRAKPQPGRFCPREHSPLSRWPTSIPFLLSSRQFYFLATITRKHSAKSEGGCCSYGTPTRSRLRSWAGSADSSGE
jgi:hypothetical protein